MRKRLKLISIIAVAVLSLTGICCQVFAASSLDSANKKKAQLENQKKQASSRLAELNSLKGNTAEYITQLDASLEEIENEISDLEKQIDDKAPGIKTAEAELIQAEADSRKQYADMKLRIKYMYEQSGTGLLDALFDETSLTKLFNKSEYIEKISEYDRAKLDEYEASIVLVKEKKRKLEEEVEDLSTLIEISEAKSAELENLINEKQSELQSYESQIGNTEAEISGYDADIEAQENEIKAIEAEIKRKEEEARKKALEEGKNVPTVKLADISFRWPCPSSSRITSKFGDRERPTKGASTDHKGIDIGAAKGENIIASAAGEVTISTYSASAGNYIMINHGGGIYTVYMHASKMLVNEGDYVYSGDVIGKVGSTGYSTGPHLHFGIRYDGEYINPLKYVSP